MNSLKKLKCTSFFPQEAFHSQLKGTHVTDEEYALHRRVWGETDFFTWYNNLNVEPMLQTI